MMNIAIYAGREDFVRQDRIVRMLEEFSVAGCNVHTVMSGSDIHPDTDMLLSIGGDGTFLSASALVSDSGIPVAGVNLGRLGFLSENRPEDVAQAVLSNDYTLCNLHLPHTEQNHSHYQGMVLNPVPENYVDFLFLYQAH